MTHLTFLRAQLKTLNAALAASKQHRPIMPQDFTVSRQTSLRVVRPWEVV